MTNAQLAKVIRTIAEDTDVVFSAPSDRASLLEAALRLEASLDTRPSVDTSFLDPLTKRERAVVDLLLKGTSTREIGTTLNLTLSTVNTYIKRIFGKLGVRSRLELVAKATGRV